MRKLIANILLLIIITPVLISQSCLPYGITFSVQDDIDNFQINYPGCTEIEADVLIEGSNITNLNGLNVLTSIGGFLTISNVINLSSLTGLDQLISIGHNLQLTKCHSISDFSGLENLSNIEGDLIIWENNSLTSLNGLDNISPETLNKLKIYHNPVLNNCDILPICEYLSNPNGEIIIHQNGINCKSPVTIAEQCNITLQCLPYGRYMFTTQSEIDSFPVDFPGCNDLNGRVNIIGYDVITNLNGLSQITSIEDILYINLVNIEDITGLENLNSIGSNLTIHNCDYLKSLAGLNNLTTVGGLTIRSNDSLVSLFGLNKLNNSLGKIQIIQNPSLAHLNDLYSLTSVVEGLIIDENHLLATLSGLDSLQFVTGYLNIENNNSLISLAGIDNIIPESVSELQITNNPLLSLCDVNSVCSYLINNYGYSNIVNNFTGCNSETEIENACSVTISEERNSKELFIYPNPVCNELYLGVTGNIDEIIIYNQTGVKVFHKTNTDNKINISGYPTGLYFINIKTNEMLLKNKFVVM